MKIQEWESCQKAKFEAKMRHAEVNLHRIQKLKPLLLGILISYENTDYSCHASKSMLFHKLKIKT